MRRLAPDAKTLHHPDVGGLHLGYESMPLEHSMKQRFVVFCAEPGSPDHDKLTGTVGRRSQPTRLTDSSCRRRWCPLSRAS
ncbi:hypothetical protein [Streptomyces sp. WAC01280]|uniref:MmyB family transcriptional regulator n=1 Tax=Streptomyces sp. WAC01280 TaxID=2487424 RepID=UPI0021B08A49|nr:hypothetical protein [Streptomyces sp. WAC01280]